MTRVLIYSKYYPHCSVRRGLLWEHMEDTPERLTGWIEGANYWGIGMNEKRLLLSFPEQNGGPFSRWRGSITLAEESCSECFWRRCAYEWDEVHRNQSARCFQFGSQGDTCPLFIQLHKHQVWELWQLSEKCHHNKEKADFTAPTGWLFSLTAGQRFCLFLRFKAGIILTKPLLWSFWAFNCTVILKEMFHFSVHKFVSGSKLKLPHY